MTKTTNTRQLREMVSEMLKARGVELQIVIDVCSAITRFLDDTKDGHDPVKVREEIVNAVWVGIEGNQPFEKMRQRIMGALHINLSENPTWNLVVGHCLKQAEAGQTIEQYAAACEANPFGMPKPFQMAQKPQIIIDTWPQAFVEEPERPEYKRIEPEDPSEFVPRPAHLTPRIPRG